MPVIKRKRVGGPRSRIRSDPTRYPLNGEASSEGFVGEASARYGAVPRRVRIALQAAKALSESEFGLVERILELHSTRLSEARREQVAQGLARTLKELSIATPSDPLASLDEPINESEAARVRFLGELEGIEARERVLRDSVNASDASGKIQRSRQALERLRRAGRVLAIRVRNQWRYPLWQFDLDAPGGVLPGLGSALEHLRLSPTAAALWLTRANPRLGGMTPVQALRRKDIERVARVAEEAGHMP
jgi:hypothetical protein